MKIDLSTVGMEKGCLYETILTTENSESLRNAAPFGVIVMGQDKVMIRMFEGTRTVSNIKETKQFIVNITDNSFLFTKTFLDNAEDSELNENNTLKDCQAYFKCEVEREIETVRDDDINVSGLVIINAKVTELTINEKSVKPLNRATTTVLDCLVDFSRIDMVDEDSKNQFLKRIKDNKKLIKKVGSKKDKRSIELIEEKLIEKGYSL